ncbi:hypothetical protein ACFLTI_09690, partial [Bacteroidota bacterium]
TVENYDNGNFKSGKLANNSKVENFICKNILILHSNGRIQQCKLAEDVEFNEIKFPKNTIIFFKEDGKLDYCWLGKSVKIQGYPCKGGQKTQTSFHPNGKIQCLFLSEAFKIQDIYCKASIVDPVCFFPDGKIKECTSEIDQTINGRFVKAGSKLLF